MPTKRPPLRVRKARPAPTKPRLTFGTSEVYIGGVDIQMGPPVTITVSGTLNPPGGTVNGSLWDSNGMQLQGAGANPSAQSDPITGNWTMQFNLANGTQGNFTLKVVYNDPTDPASDATEVEILSPPPPPPPVGFAKPKRFAKK